MSELWTENIGLFEEVLHVISDIGKSRSPFNRNSLENNLDELCRLGCQDNNYLIPSYYIAMIKDILGNFKQAETDLNNLIESPPYRSFTDEIIPTRIKTNPIELEIRTSCAVAKYHQATHKSLNESEKLVCFIISYLQQKPAYLPQRRTFIKRTLLRAEAILAQIHATRMVPEDAGHLRVHEKLQIIDHYNAAIEISRHVLDYHRFIPGYRNPSEPVPQIQALARNARGLANMYYTDFFYKKEMKIKLLNDVILPELKADEDIFRNDPSISCDIASCKMRIAYWADKPELYEKAIEKLTEVVINLWPNYGFAHFELGRIERLKTNFLAAQDRFRQALEASEENRGVTTARIEREVQLAYNQDASYP